MNPQRPASQQASFVTANDLEVDGGLGGFGAFAARYDSETVADKRDQ
nr:hypothetical protein [Rhodopirellula sp. SM50]